MSDIGIIGSFDLVGILKLLDIETYPAKHASEARPLLEKIIGERRNRIVFVLESLACEMREEMMRAGELDFITVVPLPDHISEVSYIDDELKRLARQAVGMEV